MTKKTGFDDMFEGVFGKGGLFDKIFDSKDSVKKIEVAKTTTQQNASGPKRYASFSDLRHCKFALDEANNRIVVYIPGIIDLINHESNTTKQFYGVSLVIRESKLKPKNGFAFDLEHPIDSHVGKYIGKAKEGDEDVLRTFYHLKGKLK